MKSIEIIHNIENKYSICSYFNTNVEIYYVQVPHIGDLYDSNSSQTLFIIHNNFPLNKLPTNSAFISFPINQDLQTITIHIQNLLLKETNENMMKHILLEKLMRREDISNDLNVIALQENVGIGVIDISGKVLYHSYYFLLDIDYWKQSISDGYCPPEFMEHIKNVRVQNKSKGYTDSLISYCEEASVYYLSSRIIINNQLIGYVFIIKNNDQFSRLCKETSLFLANSISKYYVAKSSHHITQTTLFTDLLNGMSEKQLETRLKNSEISLPSSIQLIVIQAQYVKVQPYITQLYKSIHDYFNYAYSLIYDDHLILIIDSRTNDYEEDLYMHLPTGWSKLKEYCHDHKLTIGISHEFDSINQMKRQYENVIHLLSVSKFYDYERDVLYTGHYIIYQILSMIPSDKDLSLFEIPALHKLQLYDEKHNTELYNTLVSYADFGFNQNLTAQHLYLHRNTLNYRRRKILEITGIDLDDPIIRLSVQTSIAIDRFQKSKRIL